MREILFKGKTDKNEWVEGYFEKYNGCSYINLQTERLNSGGYPIREFVEVIPETVGQYTGLTDKNGKKIFEGDIINIYRSSGELYCKKGVVAYSEVFSGFMANKHISLYGGCVKDIFEVVGNIYDNPEPLKGGAE